MRDVLSVIKSVHICFDNFRFLNYICNNNLQSLVMGKLRFGFSPCLIENIAGSTISTKEMSERHTLAISYLRASSTVKTTGEDRTKIADNCILRYAAQFENPSLLEVGVSDGCSALNLLEHEEKFSSIKLTDRFPYYYAKKVFMGTHFLDAEKNAHARKWLFVLVDSRSSAAMDATEYRRIDSINHKLKANYGFDELSKFDVFTSMEKEKYDLIKCANVLNKSYFSDEQLVAAVHNLARSLSDNGILVISQNNDKYPDDEAVVVLKKHNKRFTIDESINEHDICEILNDSNLSLP